MGGIGYQAHGVGALDPDRRLPAAVLDCGRCGEAMLDGELYYEDGNGGAVCCGCIDDMGKDELLRRFGCFEKVAGAKL